MRCHFLPAGIFAYSIFGELFGSSSPNALYSKALKKVTADDRVCDAGKLSIGLRAGG
jgi:hypothetical protein